MSSLFKKIFKIFIDILLLQAGPQDIPASRFLLQSTLGLYFVAGALVGMLNFPFLAALGISFVDTSLIIAMIWSALQTKKLNNRIPQTLTAVFGTLGLLTVISLPVDIWFANFSNADLDSNQFPSLVMLLLLVWSLAVLGHILRHALNIALPLAAGLSFLYFIISLLLTTILFVPVGNY